MNTEIEKKCIDAIRFLSIDMVQKANSGHPGAPMSLAPLAFALWKDHLNFNPDDPDWVNRDRFILSAGHASALLYSMLHLTGYDLTIDDLKNFRQYGSKTPGHPENTITNGVEATTGPLGQGFSNGVGMAIAAKKINAYDKRFGNHYIYSIVSDGDLMEGISSEAASLAGTLNLENIIYIYDSNRISIEGSTDKAFTENVKLRFESYNWDVIEIDNSENYIEISKGISEAKKSSNPSLIILKSKIGFGSPNKFNSEKAHGEALGEEEVKLTRNNLNWNYEPFEIPNEIYSYFSEIVEKKKNNYNLSEQSKLSYPELDIDDNWLNNVIKNAPPDSISTRDASGKVLNAIASQTNLFFGGSADLAGSTKTLINSSASINSSDFSGLNMHYGVREHAMAAINNGISLYGPFIPYGGTFLIFSDYMRNSIRLSALSKLQVLYILTHDSIGLGEDGPTHQPISQLMSLRLIPNLNVYRPADYFETIYCYKKALEMTNTPSSLVLSRQSLPTLEIENYDDIEKGAYILKKEIDGQDIDLILIGTGSEVSICLEASKKLKKENVNVRVVSMPCWELFEQQSEEYKNKVLPKNVDNKISVEAGTTIGWSQYVGNYGTSIGINDFGESAPGKVIMEKKGFSVENICNTYKKLLER
ncbi:MAG: transketolase [Chloroflexota bacterium]|nr:transketolase [Chloroflexota bacterium]|tara:strand:+ start:3393 stop:5330 length:1938 start_codon:yes stop_codon:yes gene_type:complete